MSPQLSKVRDVIDKGNTIIAVFLDLSCAFETQTSKEIGEVWSKKLYT